MEIDWFPFLVCLMGISMPFGILFIAAVQTRRDRKAAEVRVD